MTDRVDREVERDVEEIARSICARKGKPDHLYCRSCALIAAAIRTEREARQKAESELAVYRRRERDCSGDEDGTPCVSHLALVEAEAHNASLLACLREIEIHCPCGARPESLNTHPHVLGCPVARALASEAPE